MFHSQRSIATQRSLSLSLSLFFFWDGGGEGSGPALWIPQCSVYYNFKVKTCSTRKLVFILFQVTSSYRFVKTGKSMEILKHILEFGDILPRCIFVILATNISSLIIVLHILKMERPEAVTRLLISS